MSDNLHSVRLWDWDELRNKLKSLGCSISDRRVPFTYHHDAARYEAYKCFGNLPSRSDIASALDNACAGNDELYEADLILGCIKHFKQFYLIYDNELEKQMAICQNILEKNGKKLFWYLTKDTARVEE